MRNARVMALTAVSEVVLLLALHGAALASGGPPPMLNPYVRTSPSAKYSLSVNPSDLFGRGPAECRFAKSGATVWTNRFPFTASEQA